MTATKPPHPTPSSPWTDAKDALPQPGQAVFFLGGTCSKPFYVRFVGVTGEGKPRWMCGDFEFVQARGWWLACPAFPCEEEMK